MAKRNFFIKILAVVLLIGFFSCTLAGGIEKIPGLDYVAKQVAEDCYPLYGSQKLDSLDGQGRTSFLQLVLSGNRYFERAWEWESSEAMALALEENQGENNNLSEETIMPATGTIGDVHSEEASETSLPPVENSVVKNPQVEHLKKTLDKSYLLKHFYIVDATTSVSSEMLSVKKLLEADNRLKKTAEKKQVLIYHTHGASEGYKKGSGAYKDASIVAVGEELAKQIEARGYGVIHDKTKYDYMKGGIDRSAGYNVALKGISKTLDENKDIEVVIDLHRDGVAKNSADTVSIKGKETARIMFFNGISRSRRGPISYLNNPNMEGNLAFSLQLKLRAMEIYPEFTKPIYLKGYRYNLHVKRRSLLIELGNQNNTVDEAMNAVEPIAEILDDVLAGKAG